MGVRSGKQADVRRVAEAQKVILVCILIQIINIVFQLVVTFAKLPVPQPVLLGCAVVSLISSLVSAIFVIILAIRVYNTCRPLAGHPARHHRAGELRLHQELLVLLMINSKATGVLTANGHKVGLMGADLSSIPAG